MKSILFAFVFLFLTGLSYGDTVHLRNGNSINGKVVKNPDTSMSIKPGHTRIIFNNKGWMDIQTKQIEYIEENDLGQFDLRKDS